MQNLAIYQDAGALAAYEEYASSAQPQNVQYLKFAKGEFLYGMEENSVEPDERFVANMESVKRGFICWGNKQVLGEEMAPVSSGHRITKASLPDHSDQDGEWAEQTSIEFTALEDNELMLFKTSSFGGRASVGALTKAFIDRIKSGEKACVPVVEMHSSYYKHKEYGRVYTPEFKIVDWLLPAGVEADEEDDDVPFDGAVEGEIVSEAPVRKKKSTRRAAR